MLNALARSLLGARSLPGRLAGQTVAGWLSRRLDDEFAQAGIDWNGRRSCLLLSFDVDFPEDALALPAIVAELRRHPLGASFACVGRWVEDYPEAHLPVVEAGYELLNHTYSHPELVNSPRHFQSSRRDLNPRRWQELSADERQEEIDRCQEAARRVLGCSLSGFRAPHFGTAFEERDYGLLRRAGIRYSSSQLAARSARYGVPLWHDGILEIPVTTCPRHPSASFDSWHAFYARGGWHRDDFGALLRRRLETCVRTGGLTNIYLDPKDRERLDFPSLFALAASLSDDVWAPGYGEFHAWWASAHPGSAGV